MTFKDDNERHMAGMLPTDHREGTVLVGPPAPPAEPDARERLRTVGLTLPELLRIEFPQAAWLVEGLLQEGSTHCLFGPPNGGKTFLAIDMIMKALEQGKSVLFYEAEGSGRDLQQRLRRANAAHQIAHPEYLRVFHNLELDLTTEEGLATVFRHGEEERPDLIVFDSLAAMAGNIDENDSSAMIRLSNALNRIKAEICAVLALHHMNKSGWTGETPTLRSLRGHGALPGRLDVAIAVLPIEQETTDLELVCDIFEVKRRDEPKLKRRRCRIAMPLAGEAAVLEMVEVDSEAIENVHARNRVDVLENEMVDAVSSAMPAGLLTAELRGMVSGSNQAKSAALRTLFRSHRLRRADPVDGERTGRIVLGDDLERRLRDAG